MTHKMLIFYEALEWFVYVFGTLVCY